INEMLEVVALSDDHVVVPVFVFNLCLDVFGFAEGTDDFDFVFLRVGRIGLDHGLLPALSQDAAALFFVQNAAVSFARLKVCLITADDWTKWPCAQNFAAILNARVAAKNAISEAQLEVGHSAVGIDKEGVVFDGGIGVGAGLARDGAILHE